jgi:hypothetical protein
MAVEESGDTREVLDARCAEPCERFARLLRAGRGALERVARPIAVTWELEPQGDRSRLVQVRTRWSTWRGEHLHGGVSEPTGSMRHHVRLAGEALYVTSAARLLFVRYVGTRKPSRISVRATSRIIGVAHALRVFPAEACTQALEAVLRAAVERER